jgi:ribose/xylose/arabinose/galactoside ABC-type transport system permease subunit
LIGTIALMTVFAVSIESFLTIDNLRNVATQSSIILVVAVPSAMLLISGYVDLSVGSLLAVSAVSAGLAANAMGAAPGAVVGLCVGALAGAVNGWFVCFRGFSPIIVTLGMLTLLRGVALILGPNPVYGFPDLLVEIGRGRFFGFPYLLLIAVAVTAIGMFVLGQVPVGRHIYAMGVNSRAAFLSGIRVRAIGFVLYVLTGLSAGLAGVMQAARLDSAPSESLGVGFELTTLTAILLGGVSFSGGRGQIFGVVLGIWFLAILQNGLTLHNVPVSWTLVVTGAALVGAAALDRISQKVG